MTLATFLATSLAGNTVAAWLIAGAIVAGGLAVARLSTLFARRVLRRDTQAAALGTLLVDRLQEPLGLLAAVFGLRLALETLNRSPAVLAWTDSFWVVSTALTGAWLATRAIDAIVVGVISPWAARSDLDVDDLLLPVMSTLAKVSVWTLGVLFGIGNAGYDIVVLLGFLVVLALGVGLAAQESVANLVAGATLIRRRPFARGHRVSVAGVVGEVDRIMLRATALRDWRGTTHIVPNQLLVGDTLVNHTSAPALHGTDLLCVHPSTPATAVREWLRTGPIGGHEVPRVLAVALGVAKVDADGTHVELRYQLEPMLLDDPFDAPQHKAAVVRVALLEALIREATALGVRLA